MTADNELQRSAAPKCPAQHFMKLYSDFSDEKLKSWLASKKPFNAREQGGLTATGNNLLLLQHSKHLPHKRPAIRAGRYLTQGRENNEPNDFRPLI